MCGRERSAERWQRNGQAGTCRKYKKSTIEANILLKTQEANRNEAKKYLKIKELFDTSDAKAEKYLKSNEISFMKVANLVVLCARKDANSPQNKQKCPVKLKTQRSFRGVGERDNKPARRAPDFHGSRSCPSADGHPETMKMGRTVDGCGAGVSPAVAGASRSRARAEPVLSAAKECPRDSGRDARTTIFKAAPHVRRFISTPRICKVRSSGGLTSSREFC